METYLDVSAESGRSEETLGTAGARESTRPRLVRVQSVSASAAGGGEPRPALFARVRLHAQMCADVISEVGDAREFPVAFVALVWQFSRVRSETRNSELRTCEGRNATHTWNAP